MKKKFDYLKLFVIIDFIVLVFSITFLIIYLYPKSDSVSGLTNIESINIILCENKTLRETSECLRDYVKTFYNYTFRTVEEKNITKILESGGDCSEYSYVYKTYLTNLGFLTKEINIHPNDNDLEIGHRFLIAWDKNLTEYCKIDLLKISCEEFA